MSNGELVMWRSSPITKQLAEKIKEEISDLYDDILYRTQTLEDLHYIRGQLQALEDIKYFIGQPIDN